MTARSSQTWHYRRRLQRNPVTQQTKSDSFDTCEVERRSAASSKLPASTAAPACKSAPKPCRSVGNTYKYSNSKSAVHWDAPDDWGRVAAATAANSSTTAATAAPGCCPACMAGSTPSGGSRLCVPCFVTVEHEVCNPSTKGVTHRRHAAPSPAGDRTRQQHQQGKQQLWARQP